jgi:hypothetical protein
MTYEELSVKLVEAESALVTYQREVAVKRRVYAVAAIKSEIKNVNIAVKRMSKISNSLLPAGDICRACNGTGKTNRYRRR